MANTGAQGRSWRRVYILAGVLVIAGIVIVAVLVSRGHSSAPKSSTPVANESLPLQALQSHHLLYPECTPLEGRPWVYPSGVPVAGLMRITANIKSSLYEVFAIGYSCKQASTWIKRLSETQIPIKSNGNETVLKGPAGYHCSAWPDANGRAYAGSCQLNGGGSKGFGWNWNVAARRVVFAADSQGIVRLFRIAGTDVGTVFRYQKNSYELQVSNTSGIGYLNGFSWAPSSGWKVTRITKVTGATCSLTAAGTIHCSGSVAPPRCLCAGDGGSVTIEFKAVATSKKAGYLRGELPNQLRITKMTPVPYIIPGSPGEASKRGGV